MKVTAARRIGRVGELSRVSQAGGHGGCSVSRHSGSGPLFINRPNMDVLFILLIVAVLVCPLAMWWMMGHTE